MSRHRGEHEISSEMCEESGCPYLAVIDIDGSFGSELCEDHLQEAYCEIAADNAIKYAKENM